MCLISFFISKIIGYVYFNVKIVYLSTLVSRYNLSSRQNQNYSDTPYYQYNNIIHNICNNFDTFIHSVYPSLRFYSFFLCRCSFADCTLAPQLTSYCSVCSRHHGHWQKICQYHKSNIVSEIKRDIILIFHKCVNSELKYVFDISQIGMSCLISLSYTSNIYQLCTTDLKNEILNLTYFC